MQDCPTLDLSNDTTRSSVAAHSSEKSVSEISAPYLSAKFGAKIGAKKNFGGKNFLFLKSTQGLSLGFTLRASVPL